ncbi:MAG TPA: helix-turn-helix domain-containing protein, partial [Pseudonocardiaceae bacterium]|nr:helix-turn-helix domain-containing protein [Pseudonocardiaceae bacterium]
MSRKVVTMEQKLAAVFADVARGRVTVVQVCAELGISRDTFYRYRRQFAEEGLAGLQPRSRAPKTSPTRTGEPMTGLIVAARHRLEREGWDNGALSIHARLLHDGVEEVPSARTIHRVLQRQGLVEPEPRKRPRSSLRRFVFPATDDCWQIDAFEHTLAGPTATVVVVFEVLDDHSRYMLESLAWPGETTEGAWTAMARAIARYGTPRMVLADNGLAFTGRGRMSSQVLFEKNLARLGIKLINSRPLHPQTNGKNERAHRTAYNRRPHQGIDQHTPLQRRLAGTRPTPPALAEPIPHTEVIEARASSRDGYLAIQKTIIPLGVEYAALPVTAFVTGDHALIFYREQLVRELIINRSLKRQPAARPRTTKRRTLTYDPPLTVSHVLTP